MKIVVEKLEVWYNSTPALKDVSLEVRGGEMAFVIGPNGAGKSTLLKTIASIVKPRAGAVYVDGKLVSKLSPRELGRLIAYVDPHVNTSIPSTVFEFLLTARYPHQSTLSFSMPQQDLEIVEEVSKQLNVSYLLDRRLDQLSSGEMQRILLARAFVQRPKVLLLDEPSAFLDLRHRLEVLNYVRRSVEASGIACIVAIHDLYLASLYADKVIVINSGEIVAAGTREEALREDLLEKVYRVKVSLLDVNGRRVVVPLEPVEGV